MGKSSKLEDLYWNDILSKFGGCARSMKAFCDEHDVDKRKLYYIRKRVKEPE